MSSKFTGVVRAVLVLATLALCAAGAPPGHAADCKRADSSVSNVYTAAGPGTTAPASPPKNVALRNWVVVEVQNLKDLVEEASCRQKGIVVLLNGHPVKGLTVFGPGSLNSKLLSFRLLRTDDARSLWSELLGSPDFDRRHVAVTVGIEGQTPVSAEAANTVLNLKPLDEWWAAAALLGFLALFAGFLILAKLTNILRESSPPPGTIPVIDGRLDPTKSAANNGTYSLSRLQGAWWFFIILAAYLLIGIVTWDFYNTISSTAVILLGIGAGTVIGGAVIDASKDTQEQRDAKAQKAAELVTRIEVLNDALEFSKLHAQRVAAGAPGAPPPPPLSAAEAAEHRRLVARYGSGNLAGMWNWLRVTVGRPFLTLADLFELADLMAANPPHAAGSPGAQRIAQLQAQYAGANTGEMQLKVPSAADVALERKTAISSYRKMTNQSEWWFIDIMSDANGVNFHRFQLFAWTIVLGVVFAVSAYRVLAMPIFDATLMGLLGLSAGTYLGLKIPEPTVSK